jgi:aminopeptidase N
MVAPASDVRPATAAADAIDVTRYNTRVELDVTGKSVRGDTELLFVRSSAPQATVRFPLNGLHVDAVRYDGKEVSFRVDDGVLTIPLPAETASSTERVTMAYHGSSGRGLVFDDRLVYGTFFTCHWMVCSEEPGDKAAFGLEVIVPATYRVVASGQLVEERLDESGRLHSRWAEERPYSPYLYGFAAGELVEARLPAEDATLRVLGVKGSESEESLRLKFHDTPRMLRFLRDRAGVPLPDGEYTQVLVPGHQAQEKSSFSLIGTAYLDPILEDPMEDWVIVHELAHQWWGNLVTCRDWSHFWLNEGIATLMTAAYKEERWGRAAYERELALCRSRWDVAKGAQFDVPLAYAGSYPSLGSRRAIQYSKGALFLNRLREELGDEAFWAGLRVFTRRHAGGTVTSADFQRAMQEAASRDLTPLFREWVDP